MSLFRFLAISLLLILGACSQEPEQQPVKLDGKGKPALWKATSQDGSKGSIWLFGTVHLLPAGTQWQSPVLDKAIHESNALVVEVTGLDDQKRVAQIFGSMAFKDDLPSLESRVPSGQQDALMEAIGKTPIPKEALGKMETWAIALTLMNAQIAETGLKGDLGVEAILTIRFNAAKKPIAGLESMVQQLGLFDNLSENDQRAMLSETLTASTSGAEELQKMLQHWANGNSDALLESANKGVFATPAVRAALIDNRNINWSRKIGTMIDKDQKVFVAVGAAHMAGPNGVPALLKKAGYKVERVQ